jgi:hypothetical protein
MNTTTSKSKFEYLMGDWENLEQSPKKELHLSIRRGRCTLSEKGDNNESTIFYGEHINFDSFTVFVNAEKNHFAQIIDNDKIIFGEYKGDFAIDRIKWKEVFNRKN